MPNTEKRISYLESKIPKGQETVLEEKYRKRFDKNARYLGHGVYEWQGLKARDTRVLFLKGVLTFEQIKYKEDNED